MTLLIIGLVLFLGVHSVAFVAPNWRTSFIEQRGEALWKGGYSLVSLVGFVLLVYGYGLARQSPVVLYTPPAMLRHVSLLLLLPVFPLFLATYLPGRIKRAAKHPTLLAVKLWALAHLLTNGTLADLLLFGGFLVWAIADRIAAKRRPVPREVPGAAPGKYNDLIALLGGLAIYFLFVGWAHQWLIGVSPLG
ncbi:MAG: NnrU family protein [Burkholderiales bacterium]